MEVDGQRRVTARRVTWPVRVHSIGLRSYRAAVDQAPDDHDVHRRTAAGASHRPQHLAVPLELPRGCLERDMSVMPILGVAVDPEVVEALNPARHSAMRVCELLTPEWRQGGPVELPGLCEVRDVDVGMVDDHAACGHTCALSVRTPPRAQLPGLCCWARRPLLSGISPWPPLYGNLLEPHDDSQICSARRTLTSQFL
jgi:hypothetical protein